MPPSTLPPPSEITPLTENKVYILTGASRGLGRALAHALSRLSISLVLTARSEQALQDLERELNGAWASRLQPPTSDPSTSSTHPSTVPAAVSIPSDITALSLPQSLISTAVRTYGRLDGLILNHGVVDPLSRIETLHLAEQKRAFDVNCFSCVPIIQLALPYLRRSAVLPSGDGFSRICVTGSGAAVRGYGGWGAYGGSKAALHHLVMTIANEEMNRPAPSGEVGEGLDVSGEGVRKEEGKVLAFSIRPGAVDTDMQSLLRERGKDVMIPSDYQKFVTLHEQGKLGGTEEVASVMANVAARGGEEISGKLVSWDGEEVEKYRDVSGG